MSTNNKGLRVMVEDVASLNIVGYAMFGIGDLIDKAVMMYVAAVFILVSLGLSIYLVIKTFKFFIDESKKNMFIRSLYSIMFCICFLLIYLFKVIL